MSNLTDLTVTALRDGVRDGAFSAVEVATAFNAAVDGADALNAFLVKTPDHALAAARAADEAKGRGDALPPLAGVPIGMKDLFATEGVATTAASDILGGFVPPYESAVSANLWRAGCGMLGKLNMDQFAMGSSNETSAFGPVVSPWRRSDGGNAPLAPGRVELAAVRRRWRRGCARRRPARTPAAPSASRPPSPASRGSSRPTAAARAGARSLSPPPWIRPGRWRAPWRTARRCWRRWRGSTRATLLRSTCPCPPGRRV